jgi:predicted dehydrogenase
VTIRLGLLAAARITGPAVVEPAQLVDGIELAAVAARNLERAQVAADGWRIPTAYGSYEELVADPSLDAIYIATPAALHRHWTLEALRAGKHVLCEKPLASNAAEAAEMVAAGDEAGRMLMEAFHWRYHPLVGQLRDLLDRGLVGRVTHLEARFDLPEGRIPRTDIRWDLSLGGGALMDLGCYPVQWVRWAVGEEPEVTACHAECPVPGIDGRLRADLTFPSGATASIGCSMIGPDPDPDIRLDITGTQGRIHVENPLAPQFGARLVLETSGGTTELPVEASTTYEHQLRAFVEAVRSGQPPPTSGADSVATMAVIDACYVAAGLEPRPSAT